MTKQIYTIALPSKGAIAEPTSNFLKQSGLKIVKPNPRQYTGRIAEIDALQVLFQRVKDVAYKVADGTAQLGITGLDVVCENPHKDLIVIHDALGYGHCQLVVAVPEAWVDVDDMYDLAEVALDFREKKGRNIRVATTYPYLTRQFLQRNRIQHFRITKAEGAIEAAPMIGSADFVVDLTQTGTTLRENHLKQVDGGTILEAQACFIANRQALQNNPELLDIVQNLCELIDSGLNAKKYYQVVADIEANNVDDILSGLEDNLLKQRIIATHRMLNPSLSASSDSDQAIYTLTLTLEGRNIIEIVQHLRSIGARSIVMNPIKYLFHAESPTFKKLLETLESS